MMEAQVRCAMPTIIPADRWNFDPGKMDRGFQQNHGQELSTEAILESMDELDSRPETEELFRLICKSGQYVVGRHEENR